MPLCWANLAGMEMEKMESPVVAEGLADMRKRGLSATGSEEVKEERREEEKNWLADLKEHELDIDGGFMDNDDDESVPDECSVRCCH